MSYFMDVVPNIVGNKKLREPQIEAYLKIRGYFENNPKGEALVVLPTGTGKSGLISIAPYGVSNKRVLVITPGLVTKKSVLKTLYPIEDNFWINYDVIFNPYDIPCVEEYDADMLDSSMEKCHFIVANVHKLYTNNKRSLLNRVPRDFFDMVIVDEAHHSVADTWQDALKYFSDAKKLHLTGTPYRGDEKEIPGEEIHRTELSYVMKEKLVKYLRKSTVNHSKMFFIVPGISEEMTVEEVLQFKDREWVEKSVALSKDCSIDVMQASIKQLKILREVSPKVPHKILAVACSTNHADDICQWYSDLNMRATIVHSKIPTQDLEKNLMSVENHMCDVVVSVDMLREGYDHQYLTILALFRPYRSLNAFAQVVGRVLRAIPSDIITDHDIDNNAIVVYHEETGLGKMWDEFLKEIDRGGGNRNKEPRDYVFTNREYNDRDSLFADIQSSKPFFSETESYLPDYDFNELFEKARNNVDQEVDDKIQIMRQTGAFEESDLEQVRETLRKNKLSKEKSDLDKLLLQTRPEKERLETKRILVDNANDAAQALLEEKGIDPKSNSLYTMFKGFLKSLTPKTTNDGILVWYINDKVQRKFGPVRQREPEVLRLSLKYMNEVIEEVRRMLKCI